MKHLLRQAGAFVLLAIATIVLSRIGVVALDWRAIASLGPLALAVVAPAVSAWDRRVSLGVALGLPPAFVALASVCVWLWIALAAQNDPMCSGPHAPCEGIGILLATFPFYALATVVLAVVLGGAIRGVAFVMFRRRSNR